MRTFKEKVWRATQKIPCGKVSTYQKIAWAIRMPKAARAVGNALNKNRSKNVPCHRVIRSDGLVGGFAWGKETKEKRLRREGVVIENSRVSLSLYEVRCHP